MKVAAPLGMTTRYESGGMVFNHAIFPAQECQLCAIQHFLLPRRGLDLDDLLKICILASRKEMET
uniref:Uncharacterized protein n=1 Tax=Oryza meridionalis TaxID=40149 RepID=A0A0E0F375_9ORYZ